MGRFRGRICEPLQVVSGGNHSLAITNTSKVVAKYSLGEWVGFEVHSINK